jgi:putative acetyltransferase
MNEDYKIRRARPDDAGAICDLHRASVLGICDGRTPAGTLIILAESASPERIRTAMREAGVTVFLAETGGRAAGFSAVMDDAVSGVYVHPDYAGLGIGSALLAAAEKEAARRGVQVLRLHATLNSIRFYEKQGYAAVRESDFPLTGDMSLPCLVMEKNLAPGGPPSS